MKSTSEISPFKLGDNVKLTSGGGPLMNVELIDQARSLVHCVWFGDDNSGPHRSVFGKSQLMISDSPPQP
jgi:uncharacterized protein YodC (DUF2158 family)